MKALRTALFSLIALGFFFQSCSTKIDLYSDYKDITVVYGLLDFTKDTNFIKINKAFLGPGSALDIALIDDSCNYPGKLNCRIIESRASAEGTTYTQTRVLNVDTITVHNKKLGIFYAPDQLVYYTTDRIHANNSRYKYLYTLEIDRGDTVLTATSSVVGGERFTVPQAIMSFSTTTPTGTLKWTECPNAVVYDASVEFRYAEIWNGRDTVYHSINMEMGYYPKTALHYDLGNYVLSYPNASFYDKLSRSIGADSLNPNVERLVFEPCLTINISAGGVELYNFISVNGPSSSIVQTIPEYSNVNGGYGVFSSRTTIHKDVRLSAQTFTELLRHENWRFRQAQ